LFKLSLVPRDKKFAILFQQGAENVVKMAKEFKGIVDSWQNVKQRVSILSDLERDGDAITHDVMSVLHRTFITPFDREDIHALAKELDNITDMINTIVSRLVIYKLTSVDKNLIEFAAVIEESVGAVSCAVKSLRNMKNSKEIMCSCVEINRLENVGDAMRDKVLAELFETEKNPITVIKLKEIYQDAETILDVCEDVTHVVGAILLKQT
jgi:predicted phosphate transport protein (TIGR00153 family)